MPGHVTRCGATPPVRAVVAVLAAGVLVSGCGGEPDIEGSGTTPASESGTESGEPTDGRPSREAPGDLEPAVLTVEDLPAGWEDVAEDAGEPDSCLDRLTDPGGPFEPAASAHRSFAASDLGPFLLAVVTSSPADEVLVAADEVLVACDGRTTDSEFTTSIEAASIPDLPSSSLAVRGTESSDAGGSVEFTVVAAGTRSATALVLGITPLGEIDDGTIAQALSTMVERLP